MGTQKGDPLPPRSRPEGTSTYLAVQLQGVSPPRSSSSVQAWERCRGHQTRWPEGLAVSGTGCGQGHLCLDGGDVWPGVPVLRKGWEGP